jgi:hypothetical protein
VSINVRWQVLALTGVACIVGLLSVELLARLIQAPMLYYRSPQVRYRPHAVRTFTLQPCQSGVYSVSASVDIDCRGFRTNGHGEDDGGSPVILALGDSFTFGFGVDNSEAILRKGGCPTARVINAGTMSYGVFQELDLLMERLSGLKPHVVIHGLYWNDYQSAHPPRAGGSPVLTSEGLFVWDNPPVDSWGRGWTKWILGHSSLATLTYRASRRMEKRPPEATEGYAAEYERFVRGGLDPSVLAPVADFYRQFQTLGREHDFAPYVVVVPSVNVLEPGGALENPYRRFVVAQLDGLGIPYVDGYALWTRARLGSSTFLPQGKDAHLSASGYKALAEALAARLLQPKPGQGCPIEGSTLRKEQ